MTQQITMSDVSFAYGRLPVLENINLQVKKEEFFGIVGPNAGGKSTLIKLMLGLLKPQSGTIQTLSRPAGDMSHKCGYVPQHPTFLRDFPINVEQLVLLGRIGSHKGLNNLFSPSYSRQDRDATSEALAEVEADHIKHRLIADLSGGQLQRVLLARALVSNPEILILDEPTSNIDQRLENEIFDLLIRLNERMTIIVVSHDIAFVSSYVTRVACVNRTLVCHDTGSIDRDAIHNLYGGDVRAIRHNH